MSSTRQLSLAARLASSSSSSSEPARPSTSLPVEGLGRPDMPPKLTQPLRPAARYRPGKAPVPAADDSDYSDNDQEEQDDAASAQAQADEGNDDDDDEQVTEFTTANRAAKGRGAAINVALKQVEVDQTGKVKVGGRDEVGRTEMESSEGEYGPPGRSLTTPRTHTY